MPQPSQVELVIEAYRQRLLAQDAEQMREMARRWLEVERALEARVALLVQQAADVRAKGKTLTASRLYQMEHYQRLLAQAKAEVQRYNRWAADLITRQQERAAQQGIESAVATIRASYMQAGQVGAYFDLLPVKAVDAMIGYAGDGTPLNKLLMRDYPESVADLTQALIDAIAAGRNPRETARLMLDKMSGNLNRALTTARTEQIRAYRQASRQQMIESGVVSGYIRRAALNDRTCMACIALDGTEYDTDELMEVHPSDRCFMQPKIKGLKPVETTTGSAWFKDLDPDTQKQMMGQSVFEAWQSGKFDLRELASTYTDPIWGPTVRVTPLSELVQ